MKKFVLIVGLILSPILSLADDYGFGGDTTGTDAVQRVDSSYIVDSLTSPANTGTLDSGIIWLDANYKGPHTVNIVIYNSDSTFLDSTADFTVNTDSRVRYKADFVEGASISSETQYFIGFHLASEGGDDGAIKYHNNSGGSQVSAWYKSAQASIPSTITGPTKDVNSRAISMYVFYSDDGGGSSGQVIIIGGAATGKGKF